jgi:protein gp37
MGETSIEWTGFTTNPIRARPKNQVGARSGHYCEKVSPGCKNCYSSSLQPRFGMPQFQDAEIDDLDVYLDAEVLRQVLRRRAPTKFFWCSMTDMFGRWVPDEWIAACFGVMAATPHHTHQVLTKRAERLPEWFRSVANGAHPRAWCVGAAARAIAGFTHAGNLLEWPLLNVHVGVSVETQEFADERIPYLRRTPAAARFVSAEPLLGPVDLFSVDDGNYGPGWELKSVKNLTDYGTGVEYDVDAQSALDWIIVGGESGNRARPCELDWIRSLVQQCKRVEVPVLVKQLGAKPFDGGQLVQLRGSKKGGDIDEFPEELRVREFPL